MAYLICHFEALFDCYDCAADTSHNIVVTKQDTAMTFMQADLQMFTRPMF